ncbi:MAG TPA: S9 family peptidase [Vicinamibacterales bacterium]|nr:S9 family peptidase [Vicinamibacterales bacterium]
MPGHWFVLLTLAVSSVLAFTSTTATQAKRPMTLVDLLNIPRVGDPQLAPDGTRVTFLLASTDWTANRRVPQIWQINTDGTQLRRLTSSEDGAASARWSPDGSTIAYLSRGSVFVVPSAGGPSRQVSKRVGASDIAWHPDGAAIYFLAVDPPTDAARERQRVRGDVRVLDEIRQRHLWKMAVVDGAETRVTSGTDYIHAFKIASSGQRIIISRGPSQLPADADAAELWSIAADGTAPIRLTTNEIPEEDGALAPDGTQVLFVARANHRQQPYYNANLFLVHANGGPARALMPDFRYEVLRAGWSSNSTSIWMIVNLGVRIQLIQVDVASREIRHITKGDHAVVPPSWSYAGGRHLFMIDEPSRIGDIWTWAPGDAAPTRVTGIYDYLDRTFALPRQEQVEWKGVDGVAVEGILTYPTDYKPGTRYPLVVQMHGGPEASDRFGWGSIFFYYQPAWAGRGYAILRPNYRGSSGYGNTSYREPVGGYFKNSHLDVLAGVDRIVAMGVADPDRLAMMGWSAGGHLVNKLITFTTRFKAASSGAGVANWISLYGVSDTRSDRDLWLGGTLWQKDAPIETYWEHSPLKHITNARTPTLFLIGENDSRVPMSQAIELSRALKAQGVPTEVHIAPNEGHDWTQPRHQLYKMNTEMEWFERYVRKLPYTPEAVPTQNDPNVLPAP